jgi:tRNA(adenine34) deaminase
MNDFWHSKSPAWQACLSEAWAAYCAGSLPIGAAVVNREGDILARGRNRWHQSQATTGQISGSRLAHAEINALIQLPHQRDDYRDWSLYTTLEPCPLCVGALYMYGLRRLHFAARDPWAGSTNMLGTTPYLSRKIIQVHPPHDPDLESLLVGIGVVAILEERITRTQEVLESKRTFHPTSVAFGQSLFAAGMLARLKEAGEQPAAAFNHIADLWYVYERA